jgi:hypothetical protein
MEWIKSENNHVLMNNWRPNRKVRGKQTRFWGAISFSSMSVKDRSLLVPLVMLNACLTFSWPNKVPFDREASDTFSGRDKLGLANWCRRGLDADAKSEPKMRSGSRPVPG